MNIQQTAVDSVKRRGFYDNLPPNAYNTAKMEIFLHMVKHSGTTARTLRKRTEDISLIPVVASSESALLRNALLVAQMLRITEELGELAAEIIDGDANAAMVEAADVAIVIFQVAEALGCDLESMIHAKLKADEQRGHLHQGVTA